MKTLGSCLLIAGTVCFFACSNGTENKHEDTVDSAKAANKEIKAVQPDASNFALKAADGGMMEVELGKIAESNAANHRVRAFGEMMVRDHSQANDNLKSIAGSLNIVLPDSVSNDSKKEIDDLKKKKGKDFDKAYVKMMVEDHKKDIDEFRKCADNCSDSSIKAFAAATLPVLQKHLDTAKRLKTSKSSRR